MPIRFPKTQEIRHRRAIQTDLAGSISLRKPILIHQTSNAIGSLEHIEIFTLKVFNKGPLGRGLIIDSPNDGWYLRLIQELECSPTTLSSNKFKA